MRNAFSAAIVMTCLSIAQPGYAVDQSVVDMINSKPKRIVCEIKPRPGSKRSYLVYYVTGATASGIVRYRAPTTPPHEISIAPDGSVIEGRNPCITEPVALD